ncbi:hypothetical protein M2273_000476 [Mucilaginibacter lappiensis]|jgi:hypothetical protein
MTGVCQQQKSILYYFEMLNFIQPINKIKPGYFACGLVAGIAISKQLSISIMARKANECL